MYPFNFVSNVDQYQQVAAHVVDVPADIQSKAVLLTWYADALHFPKYFGFNWDAFQECLCDLSWLKGRALVLRHKEVPLTAYPNELLTYVDILANAVQSWGSGNSHEIVVVFSRAAEVQLRALVDFDGNSGRR